MRKHAPFFMILLFLLGLLTGCGDSQKYDTYSVDSITFEIPSEWNIEPKEDGSASIELEDGTLFSVIVNDCTTNEYFKLFGESLMVGVINNQSIAEVQSYSEMTLGSHTAYDYKINTLIDGYMQMRCTAIQGESKVVTLMLFGTVGGDMDYNEVYDRILKSVK